MSIQQGGRQVSDPTKKSVSGAEAQPDSRIMNVISSKLQHMTLLVFMADLPYYETMLYNAFLLGKEFLSISRF
jgi:hypothetical protein